MLVRHFMNHDVITLSPEQTCHEAQRIFKQHDIRRAPVLDQNQLVGIVSEGDLLHFLPGTIGQMSTEAGKESMDIPVKNIMKTHVQILNPNDHIEMAARLMLKHKIGGIPVVDKGKLKGIITESDIFKAMWKILFFEKGCRILFLDERNDTNKVFNDYIELCLKHGCQVHTFIQYPNPSEGYMYYLCVKGGTIDILIKDLWSHHCKVLLVEREECPTIIDKE